MKPGKFTPITLELVATNKRNRKIQFPVIGITKDGKYVIAGADRAETADAEEYTVAVKDWHLTFTGTNLPRLAKSKGKS